MLTLHREAVDRLAALGVPVVYLAWREPEDVKACMRLMGEVFDKPQVARAYQRWFDGTLARVSQGAAPGWRRRSGRASSTCSPRR